LQAQDLRVRLTIYY